MIIGKVPRSLGTHDGSFHADEVTACAILLYFEVIDRDKIIRTRDVGKLETCDFVCDVGGEFDPKIRRFDHQQEKYTGDLSSAGMIWSYLKDEKIISQNLYDYLNRSLIRGIDDIDNGKNFPTEGHCSFSQVIATFVPASYEASESEMNDAFNEALDFVLEHIDRSIKKYEYIESCSGTVREVMEQMDECLVFDKAIPWQDAFFQHGGEKHSAEFILMPAGKHYKLRGLPPNFKNRMDVRRPFPKGWRGKMGKELEEVTGIPGAIFCHRGGWISMWSTKEAALKALKIMLETK